MPSATFFPEPEADAYVAEALERGARVFKVHLQVGAFDPRDPLLAPVWRRLAAAGRRRSSCHAGPARCRDRSPDPEPIGEVLAAHPELTAVIAHMGGGEYEEFLDLALRYPNVHLDTTMTFTDFMNALGRLSARTCCRCWPSIPTASCSAATSRTSRTRTRTSSRRWSDWAWATTGCGRSATTTARGCWARGRSSDLAVAALVVGARVLAEGRDRRVAGGGYSAIASGCEPVSSHSCS